MDVRLSGEQRALRDAAAQLVNRLGPSAVADLDDEERVAKLDAALAASGWRELRTADEDGAPWSSAVEVAIVTEELARGLADTPYLGAILAAELRRLVGAPSASAETVAMSSDLAGPATATATAVAADAAGATTALLLLGEPGDQSLAEVALSDDRDRVDLTRPSARPAEGALPQPVADQQWTLSSEDITRWTALGIALSCADLVGAMRGTIGLAASYATVRQQYGAPIGSFQAVQHVLADAQVSMEGSRSIALHAAWAVDALPPEEAVVAAATAKAYCARAAREVCEASIQVHGGIGHTWECLAHVYLRRAIVSSDLFGNVGASLARLIDHHELGHHESRPADGLR
jgi:alkylation response protein AidB-like acyl-CoA dehydrogenase